MVYVLILIFRTFDSVDLNSINHGLRFAVVFVWVGKNMIVRQCLMQLATSIAKVKELKLSRVTHLLSKKIL
jgi:hypothetical protein